MEIFYEEEKIKNHTKNWHSCLENNWFICVILHFPKTYYSKICLQNVQVLLLYLKFFSSCTIIIIWNGSSSWLSVWEVAVSWLSWLQIRQPPALPRIYFEHFNDKWRSPHVWVFSDVESHPENLGKRKRKRKPAGHACCLFPRYT